VRIAFVSDIHANRFAFDAVFKDMETQGVDQVVCLGDIVGYGPDPNGCVDYVRERSQATVLGNHDQAALGQMSTEYFNEYARTATQWTADALTPESREFLMGLPMSVEFRGLRLVHSSPLNPEEWTYVLTLDEAERQFDAFAERLCFIGHSHLPIVLELSDHEVSALRFPPNEPIALEPDNRYIVNVGSVGQPRDRDPRSAYAWYDSESGQVSLRRVEYSIPDVQQLILDAGLPSFLASRLAHGL